MYNYTQIPDKEVFGVWGYLRNLAQIILFRLLIKKYYKEFFYKEQCDVSKNSQDYVWQNGKMDFQ